MARGFFGCDDINDARLGEAGLRRTNTHLGVEQARMASRISNGTWQNSSGSNYARETDNFLKAAQARQKRMRDNQERLASHEKNIQTRGEDLNSVLDTHNDLFE